MNAVTAVFYRDVRQRLTNITMVFWDLLAPLSYLALFGLGFERMMGSAPVLKGMPFTYTAFLVPGVMAMVTFGVGMNTSWGFFMDKESGIVYEMLTYPITRAQILLGKVAFNVTLALTGTVLIILVGIAAMGLKVHWHTLPLLLLVMTVSMAAWFHFFGGLAIVLDRMDTFNAAEGVAYLMMMFFSSMFYPLENMPAWFRFIGYINPMTWQVDLLRFSLLGTGNSSALLFEGIALSAFSAACMTFAVRALNRLS